MCIDYINYMAQRYPQHRLTGHTHMIISPQRKAEKIAKLVALTGCTEDDARAELISEEWDDFAALIHLRYYMQQKADTAARP